MGDDAGVPVSVRRFDRHDFSVAGLLAAKAERTVSVCIPARDEARTVGRVVRAVLEPHGPVPGGSGLVDEVVVVDDRSADATAEVAAQAGARVLRQGEGRGKGDAMRAGLEAALGEFVVFLDADVENTDGSFVTGLLGPLLVAEGVTLVKGTYDRPLGEQPTGGGRVTELVARPLLQLLFPELTEIRQPLAGETAGPRWALEKLTFDPDYGVELGLLIDAATRFGVGSIAQVDLGVRIHRNRPLAELRPQAVEVLRAGLSRAGLPLPRS
jgi:glucosyl-3-phosphoglycerate synthase